MLMPSIFGENLFDDFFTPFYYDDKEIRRLKKISQISLIPTGFRTKTYFNIDY